MRPESAALLWDALDAARSIIGFLENRGVRAPVAALAAASGIAVLSRARLQWLAGASDDYAALLTTGFADLRAAVQD